MTYFDYDQMARLLGPGTDNKLRDAVLRIEFLLDPEHPCKVEGHVPEWIDAICDRCRRPVPKSRMAIEAEASGKGDD